MSVGSGRHGGVLVEGGPVARGRGEGLVSCGHCVGAGRKACRGGGGGI
jgi:hypothetical protein